MRPSSRGPSSGSAEALESAAPPSTTRFCPVTNRASGEQRNTMTSAISSGSPKRPRGVAASMGVRNPSIDQAISVSRGPHEARGHAVGADGLGAVLEGDAPRQRDDAGLRRRVGRLTAGRDDPALRHDRHHRTTSARPEVRIRGAHRGEGPPQVDADEVLPLVVAVAIERLERADPGVGDHHREPAELRRGLVDGRVQEALSATSPTTASTPSRAAV